MTGVQSTAPGASKSGIRYGAGVYARVAALHAEELNDHVIAARMHDVFTGPRPAYTVYEIRKRRLGLPTIEGQRTTRRMTPAEDVRLRELHAAGLSDAEIRDAMRDVFPAGDAGAEKAGTARKRMGLEANKTHLWGKAKTERIAGLVRELHAAGLYDSEISRRVRVVYPDVASQAGRVVREKLGLPANPAPPEVSLSAVHGSLAGRREARAALVAKWGLPPDLSLKAFEIVIALTAGGMSGQAVAAAVGLPPNTNAKAGGLNDYAQNCLSDLRRRGLVAMLPMPEQGRRLGGRRSLYALTAACLELLRSGAERQMEESDADSQPARDRGRREGRDAVDEMGGDPVRENAPGRHG